MIFLSFFVGAVAMSFFWLHMFVKMLDARRERDEARERLRHATDEILKMEIRLHHVTLQRNGFFLETERGRIVRTQLKSWN
jgi:hypothetical protein